MYMYNHETSHKDSPWVEDVPYWFLVPKVKVTMHWLLKMVIGAQFLPFYTYNRETSHTESPWVEYIPVWFRGNKNREFELVVIVKSQLKD